MGTALRTAFLHPFRMLTSLRLCHVLGRNSSRGLPIQLIYLVEACTLLSLLRKQKVAHVHAHFGTRSTTVAMLCESLGGPTFSFTAHGPDEFDAPMDMSLGLKTERASFVAAISDYARSQVYRWCPWDDWSKVHIVPCGIDARSVNSEPTAVVQSKRFFWAGRVSEEKGLPILLEACQRLDEQGVESEVQMAGAGHLRESFEREISAKRRGCWQDMTSVEARVSWPIWSERDFMLARPGKQDVEGPDPRPIDPRRTLQERRPQ